MRILEKIVLIRQFSIGNDSEVELVHWSHEVCTSIYVYFQGSTEIKTIQIWYTMIVVNQNSQSPSCLSQFEK